MSCAINIRFTTLVDRIKTEGYDWATTGRSEVDVCKFDRGLKCIIYGEDKFLVSELKISYGIINIVDVMPERIFMNTNEIINKLKTI